MACCTYFAVFIALLPAVLCCGNVDIVLEKVTTDCADGSTSVLQVSPDFGFTISDKCILTPTGCAEVTKPVKGAQISYKIKTDVVPLTEGKYDGCELVKNASKDQEAQQLMKVFNVPPVSPDCTLQAGKVCAEGQTLDVSQHSSKMMLTTGRITTECETVHEDGSKSCFTAIIKITPKPMSFS